MLLTRDTITVRLFVFGSSGDFIWLLLWSSIVWTPPSSSERDCVFYGSGWEEARFMVCIIIAAGNKFIHRIHTAELHKRLKFNSI